MKQIRFTQEGYDTLKAEYEQLLNKRPAAVEELKKARELGDLKENGYYKAARSKLSFIDNRLTRIKFDLKQAVIISSNSKDAIDIGSIVVIKNGDREDTYQIVGDLEANPSEGKISLLSPLGKALNGKMEGEIIELDTPSGKKQFTILQIS